MKEIVLSEADIQSILNGRKVIREINSEKVNIRSSYLKDLAEPLINDRIQVIDTKVDRAVSVYADVFYPSAGSLGGRKL